MTEQRYPWPVASWTGVGSYPWDDPGEAARTVFGELPQFPHLPELPSRGAGADMVGRTAGLLVDFPVEVQPTGWRAARGAGRDLARSRSMLAYDLDAVEEHGKDYRGPFKIQAAGAWTLAASLELRSGERLLYDPGAVADLAASLCEGIARHVADVAARLPGARLVVQLDEPSLPAVLAGRIPTASGYRRYRAPAPTTAREILASVFSAVDAAGAVPAVHCCAAGAPVELLHRSGARVLGLDADRLTAADDEAVGTAVEDGAGLLLGAVPTGPAPGPAAAPSDSDGRADTAPDAGKVSPAVGNVSAVRTLWNRIGLAPDLLAEAVVATPACGLAGASPAGARAALDACRTAARVLRDDPTGA
ncbi:methionine synthase [Nocardiopsis coralliicola]